jgi:hypothetical protein
MNSLLFLCSLFVFCPCASHARVKDQFKSDELKDPGTGQLVVLQTLHPQFVNPKITLKEISFFKENEADNNSLFPYLRSSLPVPDVPVVIDVLYESCCFESTMASAFVQVGLE